MKLAEVSLQAFKNAIQEVLPQECVRKSLQLDGNQLTVQGRQYELNHNVHIVAIGKAAVGMVEGAEAALGGHVVDGIASVPVGSRIHDGLKTKLYAGAEHNLPDAAAAENARRIEKFLERVRAADQIVLFLISGGGSALLPAPVPGISLEEKLDVIKLLAQNGADIKQLNIARIALSRLKGGKLARKAAPAKCISLIISDIVGDPIDLISSGPTVLSRTDRRSPLDVLRELNLTEKVPRKILDVFEAAGSDSAETQEVN
ncbi:MOFRL family protein, partial [Aphelenchoides avenae]